MPQEKLDTEDAKTTNAYIQRVVKEVHRVLGGLDPDIRIDRKSTRLNSSHYLISYAVFSF